METTLEIILGGAIIVAALIGYGISQFAKKHDERLAWMDDIEHAPEVERDRRDQE